MYIKYMYTINNKSKELKISLINIILLISLALSLAFFVN